MNNTVIEQQQVSEIDQLKQEFTLMINKLETGYVVIGMKLNELKDKIKEDTKLENDKLANVKLMEWLKTETRLSYSSANRYMRIAECYEDDDAKAMAVNLGVKKAYLLLKIKNTKQRYEFVENNSILNKSYDETNELLLDYLNKNKPDTNKRSINSKSAIKKLKTTIDKELYKYNSIIDEKGADTPIKIYYIKDKLCELQQLLMEDDHTDSRDDRMLKTQAHDYTDQKGTEYLNFD